MLTQCPECQTVFRVKPEQLGAAGGKVRCSRCHSVFNASDNRFQPAAETDTPEQTEASGSETAAEGAPGDTAATTPAAGDETLAVAEPEPENEQAGTLDALDIAEGSAAAASSTLPSHTPADEVRSPLRQAEDNAATDETEPDSTTEEATVAEQDAQPAPAVSYGDDQPTGETAAEDITGEPPGQLPAAAAEDGSPRALTEQPESTPPTEAEPEHPASIEPSDEGRGEDAEAWWITEADEAKAVAPLPGEGSSDELQASSPSEAEEDSPTASPPEEALNLFLDEEAATADEVVTPSAPPDEEVLPDTEQGFADAPGVTADSSTATDGESGTPGEADDEQFNDELFDLFAEEPDTDTSTGEAPASDSEATRGTEQTEEPQQSETERNETASAADAEWVPFSEANIEALLTPSGESDELDSITEGGQQREVELSMDELDLSADDSVAPATPHQDEDEELLNQRLPEDEAYHELELDDSEPATETTPAEEEGRQSAEPDADEPPLYAATQESYSLPPQLEQQHPRSTRGIVLWGSGILLLLASLVLQYLYYHRTALAENASLRPLLSQMCEMTGCTLPPRRDLGRIKLADHLMQFHPRYKDSLLITATLVNRAEFSQPFPVVEVVMTDLQQKVIARRHFRPNEYLIGEQPPKSFLPNIEVPLMLEVVDPGETAVGFEFNFY